MNGARTSEEAISAVLKLHEVTFANLLSRKLKERYPDKDYRVLILAYGGAATPPIKAVPDSNLIVSSLAFSSPYFEGWAKVSKGMIWRSSFADPSRWKISGPPASRGGQVARPPREVIMNQCSVAFGRDLNQT